jgi:hypothetical protein
MITPREGFSSGSTQYGAGRDRRLPSATIVFLVSDPGPIPGHHDDPGAGDTE